MRYTGEQGEYFEIQGISDRNCEHLKETQKDTLRLLWFTSDNNHLRIDGVSHRFNRNDIVCLTQFHQLEYEQINTVNLMRFNRQFYCIIDHDSEVSCKGVLFYGAARIPVIKAESREVEMFETAWKMAALEFEMKDSLQLEMLQMVLKRFLILCTRLYRQQTGGVVLDEKQNDLVREFNFLVEKHFKEYHSVADYAGLLFKSPKTISNTFKKLGSKTPLQLIQERRVLEARRLLHYTDKDVSEIAYDLGFKDIQTFSRFFKKQEGSSPSQFRIRA